MGRSRPASAMAGMLQGMLREPWSLFTAVPSAGLLVVPSVPGCREVSRMGSVPGTWGKSLFIRPLTTLEGFRNAPCKALVIGTMCFRDDFPGVR